MDRWRRIPVFALLTFGCGVGRELPAEFDVEDELEQLTYPVVPRQSVTVDVLVVLDDASSMANFEEILEANADSFTNVLEADGVAADYHLAYLEGGQPGARDLIDRVEAFIVRAHDEAAPEHGFLRPEANLHVVFITDGDDQSLDEDGELRDVELFAEFLRGVQASKLVLDPDEPPQVVVSLVGGVKWDGSGLDPECGEMLPERLWQLVHAMNDVDGSGGSSQAFRLCDPDHSPVMGTWSEPIRGVEVTCFPGCVADASPEDPGFQPACETIEITGSGAAIELPPCRLGEDIPEGHDACAAYLTGPNRAYQCMGVGANVELGVWRREGAGIQHSEYLVTCALSESLSADCIPE